jgi:hypothetical protein
MLRKIKILVPSVLLALGTLGARAQTSAVATKTADISVFAGYQNLHPDYGIPRDNGFAIGANFTRYLGWKVDPSLEIRYNYATGSFVNEKSFEAGVRAQGDYKLFHPYVDLLGGVATVDFGNFPHGIPTYTNNSGGTFSVGGGVDIDIYRHVQAKIDYQQQNMYFAQNISLTPRPLTVGIVYRIPFSPHTSNK